MRNLSLTVKIWLAISLVSLSLYLINVLLTPYLIRNFFVSSLMNPMLPPEKHAKDPFTRYTDIGGINIRGFSILDDGTTMPTQASRTVPHSLLQEIKEHASTQQQLKQIYESTYDKEEIRYTIRKDEIYQRPVYVIMFLKKSEEDHFVQTVLSRTMLYTGLALIVSWFAALFIARYLTRPLIKMEQHVKRIAGRDWHDPLEVKQRDEMGQLAQSIESMRQQLVRQDEAQQSMLQNISHELKTPIMVIRSYAQAMQDGVYPKGDLTGSIQVIDEEGDRLEKLVKQLLYLTRLDYLSTRNQVHDKLELHGLVEKVVERLRYQRPEIQWDLELQPLETEGDEETLRVLVENILDNHLRHAVSRLQVTLVSDKQENNISLNFWNDGSKVEPDLQKEIYQPFQKGRGGKFGLGLTIVQRIVKMYQGEINLYNENDGVCTLVKIPLKR